MNRLESSSHELPLHSATEHPCPGATPLMYEGDVGQNHSLPKDFCKPSSVPGIVSLSTIRNDIRSLDCQSENERAIEKRIKEVLNALGSEQGTRGCCRVKPSQ